MEIGLLMQAARFEICNIFFEHKSIYRYSLIQEGPLGQKSIIDYIITQRQIKRGLSCGSDSCAVVSHIYFPAETTSVAKDPNQTKKAK